MLSKKQIKVIEELTGIPVLKEKIEIDKIIFSTEMDDKGSFESLVIQLNGKKELTIRHIDKSSWGSGSYTNNSIPVKWLAPLGKILEEK